MPDAYEPFPQLKTERLFLRRLMMSDAPAISELRSDPRVTQYIRRKQPFDLDAATAFVLRIDNAVNTKLSLLWCICLAGSNELIGTICLWNFSEDRKTAEAGYESFPAVWGQGYMREALTAVLEFAKSDLQLITVEAFTQKGNEASLKLLASCNFQLEPGRTDPDVPENLILSKRL